MIEKFEKKNRTMNFDIFIPARMDSKRLQKKHLLKIKGKPILKHLIDRLKDSKKVRKIVVCTTNLHSDDPLVDFCKKENIEYFRGNSRDILVRLLKAAKKFDTEIIIDVEGDKIYTDPDYVDLVAKEFENSKCDYVEGYVHDKTIHHGIHGIIPAAFRTKTLEKICNSKKTKNTETGYKEFFTKNKSIKCKFIKPNPKINFPENIRLTLDYQEDFRLAKKIFQNLDYKFRTKDILVLFKNYPDLLKITKPVLEKWEHNYKENVPDLI